MKIRRLCWFMIVLLGLCGMAPAQNVIQIKDIQTWSSFNQGGFGAGGTLQILAGGNLTVTGRSGLVDGRHLIVEEGGRFTMNARLDMDSKGQITMNGGEFHSTVDFKFPDSSGNQDVHIWLYGGLMVCNQMQSMKDRGSILHVGGGVLRLENAASGSGEWDPENTNAWAIVPIPPYAEVSITDLGGVGKEISAVSPSVAYGADPANGATDVARDPILRWIPAVRAVAHDVYLGTDLESVNNANRSNSMNVLVTRDLKTSLFAPGLLEYGQMYYWRIDEVNDADPASPWKGMVWSFTAEPYAYPITTPILATASSSSSILTGPEKTINRSGLNANDQHSTTGTDMWLSSSSGPKPAWIQYELDLVYKLYQMWVWNSNQLVELDFGLGAKDVTIEVSTDGNTWTALTGVPEFAQATGSEGYVHNTTTDLGGAMAKYVKLTLHSNWGGAKSSGLSEVRFFTIPVKAFGPTPASAATGVALDATLNWRPGRQAASHKVYLGTDQQTVTDGTSPAMTVADHCYSPSSLRLGTTYYWRVDEVNGVESPSVWKGDVWRFSTLDYFVVDDFETYNDQCNRIFYAWVDGYGVASPECGGSPIAGNGTGSTVGNLNPPYAEKTVVHSGKQAMPLGYDNTAGKSSSEATRTFDVAQNWTAHGIKSLSLFFRGELGNNGGKLFLKINNTKVEYNGSAADISAASWLPWNIDLSTVGGSLSSVTTLTIGVQGSDAKGIVYIDDVRLYPKTPEYITPTDPGKANLVALYAFEGNADDTSGHGLNGTLQGAALVSSGRSDGGSAVQLNQAGYVDLGNPAALNFGTGDWAVTAWFKTAMTGTGDANRGTLYAKGGDDVGGHRYTLCMSAVTQGVVSLTCDDDVTKIETNSTSVTNDDGWHFVVGQREGTAIRIFIDGRLQGTSTVAANYRLSGTSQHNGYIGAITNHSTGSLYKLFKGLIDDVRVYNRALSTEEVLWLSGQTTPVAKPF